MRLKLQFYEKWEDWDPDDDRAYDRPVRKIDLNVPSGGSSRDPKLLEGENIDWGGVDTIWIEANVEDYGAIRIKDEFRLQLAYDPDEKVTTNNRGFFCKDNKRGPVQLLRGACGRSVLRLLKRTQGNHYDKEIAYWTIDIIPPRWKRLSRDMMVEELLHVNPSAVRSRMLGLSGADDIETRWRRGHGSYDIWELDDKLDELQKVMDDIAPHLNAIRQRSAEVIKANVIRIPYGRLRNPQKCVSSEMWRRDIVETGVKVRAKVLCVSYDIPIHCAIKDFLIRLYVDIRNMERRIEQAVKMDEGAVQEFPQSAQGADMIRRLNQENKYRKDRLAKLSRLCERCRLFLSHVYPWAECVRKPITSIAAGSVPASISYRKVYSTMLGFHGKCFSIHGLDGNFRVPEYVLGSKSEHEEMPSTWQRNYSSIYESWVFYRLVQAFNENGFKGLELNYRELLRRRVKNVILGLRANEPIHAIISDGNMKVELIHGLLAYNGGSVFSVSDQDNRRESLTPDFAIVFSCSDSGVNKCHWLVVDAKSGAKLRNNREIAKRNLYRECISRFGRWPDQSWLVYSGRTDVIAGIEFNRDEFDEAIMRKVWDEDLEIEAVFRVNDTLRWTPKGIIGWEKSANEFRLQPVGHVRANVVALSGTECDVFAEFAKGQIATARLRLGM